MSIPLPISPSIARILQSFLECPAQLPTHLAHPLQDEFAVPIHVIGSSPQGPRQNCRKPRRLFPFDILRRMNFPP
jgi:hypothetical protein